MRQILHFMLYLSSFLFLSCSDSEQERADEVSPVWNVKYTSSNGAILFQWNNPESEDVAYVEISYRDKSGVTHRTLVKGGVTEQLIGGIADNAWYDFRFLVYNQNGYASNPVDVRAKALESVVNLFNGRVRAFVVSGGIQVEWENDYDRSFFVEVHYTDLNGGEYETEVVIGPYSHNSELVRIGAAISGTQELEVILNIVDEDRNVSESRMIRYYKKEAGKLNRSAWTIIGMSSEETTSEKAPVTNILDGDPKTFWHSQYSNLKKYPHWISIDLGTKKILEKAGLIQRHNNPMAKGISLYGTNKNGEITDSDWVHFTTFQMKLREDNADKNIVISEQSFEFPIPVTYRYVKIVFETPGEGNQDCAALAEFYLYGSDAVD